MATNEEVFGARFEIDVENLKSGITQANRLIKQSESEFKAAAAGMGDWRNEEEGLEAKLKSLNTVAELQQKKVNALEQEYEAAKQKSGEFSAEAVNASIRLNNTNAQLNKTQKEIKDVGKSLQDLKSGATDGGNALATVGDSAQDASGKMGDVSKSAIDMVKQFAPIAVGALGIKSIADFATESTNATSKLNAVLGVSGQEAEGFNQALSNIYANNYGESMEDIAEAATDVAKVLGNDISPASLEEVTTQAIILRDTFGSDVNESVKAADALMKNFGLSSTEAFDLMAKGAQSGLDKNGEMFDSFTEYSQYFADLGLSAEDMFNGMKAGTDQFLMGADKSMDAWKEFGIRVIDGSSSTAEAMSAIGLNADEMAAKFAQGGDSSKQAVEETVNALMAMDDPVAQSIAGVQLFGTQWEDMGESGMQAMFDLMGTAVEAEGTMEQIDSVRYDNLSSAFSAIGRTVETEVLLPLVNNLAPALVDFKDNMLPAIKDGLNGIMDVLPAIAPAAAAAGVAFAAFNIAQTISKASAALTAFKTAQEATTIAQAALNAVMAANPIGIVLTVIGMLVAAFATLWVTCEPFRDFWIGLWDSITGALSSAWDFMSGIFSGIIDFISGNWQSLLLLLVNPFAGAFKLLYDNCEAFREFVDNFVQAIVTFFTDTIPQAFQSFVDGIVVFFTQTIPEAFMAFGEFLSQLPEMVWAWLILTAVKIGEWIININNKVNEFGYNFIQTIITFFSQLPGKIWDWLVKTINNINTFVLNIVNAAIKAGSQFLSNVINFFAQLPGQIWAFLSNVISTISGFVGSLISAAVSAGSGFLSNIVSFISQVPGQIMSFISQIPGQISGFAGQMITAAGNLIDGLIQGIGNGAEAVVNKIKEICSGALDAVKNFFGIKSPSRVMRQMGQFIDQGFVQGLDSGIDEVAKMSDKLAEAAIPELDPTAFDISAGGINGVNSSKLPGSSKVVNVTQNFYSPETISARDSYRYGRKLQQTLAAGV